MTRDYQTKQVNLNPRLRRYLSVSNLILMSKAMDSIVTRQSIRYSEASNLSLCRSCNNYCFRKGHCTEMRFSSNWSRTSTTKLICTCHAARSSRCGDWHDQSSASNVLTTTKLLVDSINCANHGRLNSAAQRTFMYNGLPRIHVPENLCENTF